MTSCKTIGYVIAFLVWMSVCACAGRHPTPIHGDGMRPKPSPFTERKAEKPTQDPRLMTSLNLTSIGERYIQDGRYDDAIDVLEKSVAVYAQNGKNYYYLAEAWLHKGNLSLAREFNQLAFIYLKDDSGYHERVVKQKRAIDKKLSGS